MDQDTRGMYQPLKEWQTRLIKLHAANDQDAMLCCDLVIASILDEKFGVAVQTRNIEDEHIVKYDALSYTWASDLADETMRCNGKELSITGNLGQALRVIRARDDR